MKPIAMRIDEKTAPIPESGCLIWLGATQNGTAPIIGALGKGEKQLNARNMLFESLVGPIPSGMYLINKCGVGLCIRPEHQTLSTAKHPVLPTCKRGHDLTIDGAISGSGRNKKCRECKRERDRKRGAR